ncbi:MAG: hypothetical protein ABH873_00490 [Candidatus Firestonebacteria bacterium]
MMTFCEKWFSLVVIGLLVMIPIGCGKSTDNKEKVVTENKIADNTTRIESVDLNKIDSGLLLEIFKGAGYDIDETAK